MITHVEQVFQKDSLTLGHVRKSDKLSALWFEYLEKIDREYERLTAKIYRKRKRDT